MLSYFRKAAVSLALAAVVVFGLAPQSFAAIQYTAAHRSASMTDLTTAVGTTGYLCIYNGTAPANVAASESNTLLVALPMSNPIGTVTTGVLTMNSITSTAAAASGTASHFRIATSSACTTAIVQGVVATSGGDLNFSGGVIFTAGEIISVSSFTITANGS